MSSRRTAGEENILAMLERDSARRVGGRISSPRLAWYCTAAAFAGILVGVVAWLAYDNHTTATAMQVEAERVVENPAPPSPPALSPEAAPPEPVPVQLAEAPAAALIVDQPQDRPAGPPPLVMLPPEETSAAKPAVQVKQAPPVPKAEAASLPKPAPAPKTASVESAKKTEKPAKVEKADRTPKPARAVKAEKAGRTDKAEKAGRTDKAEKAQRPAARAAKPPARTAVADKTSARNRKNAQASSADTAVDNDVALISAIIQHSERHRGERAPAAACTGAKCPAPPPKP
ncbi:hypothetical protein ACSUZJ_16385 [Telluria sp. B2]